MVSADSSNLLSTVLSLQCLSCPITFVLCPSVHLSQPQTPLLGSSGAEHMSDILQLQQDALGR